MFGFHKSNQFCHVENGYRITLLVVQLNKLSVGMNGMSVCFYLERLLRSFGCFNVD